MSALDSLRLKASYWATSLLWVNAVLIAVAGGLSTGGFSVPATAAGILLAVLGTIFWNRSKAGPTTRVINAVSLCGQVSLIVFVASNSPYQIDLHMYFFAVLAMCAAWIDWRAIVAYSLVVPVHHLVLYIVMPEAVFPGSSDLSRVLLHGAIISVQAGALIALTRSVVSAFAVAKEAADQSIAAHQEVALQSEEARKAGEVASSERSAREAERATEARAIEASVDVIARALGEFSAGNLAHRIDQPLHGRMDDLRHTFNDSLTNMEEALADVGHSARTLREGASAMSRSNGQLSERTDQQSSLVEDSVKALSAVSETVGSTTLLAGEVDRMVANTKSGAERSATVVTDAVSAMSEIEASSSRISQIIGVIDEIAFQTNLLALNAGVEAARAGDAGKGFAVVAQEVRELAQRSANAAKEIKSLINASADQVKHGVDLVGQTGSALREIEEDVRKISAQVGLIVSGAKGQSQGIDSIHAMISMIDRNTQQNASMVESSVSAVEQLASEAQRLENLMSRFRFKGAAPQSTSARRAA